MMAKYRVLIGAVPVLALIVGSAALLAEGPNTHGVPAYNTATMVHMRANVAEFKIVPAGEPLDGAHVIVKNPAGDAVDVYLGLPKFVKIFNLPLNPGDKVDVLGSEVKYKGGNLVIAREVTKGAVTMILRDDNGVPMWLDWME